uniref:Uncharacterized protein n=1 Tax=Cucumis melo TaxID=3656 RepID=A0A9I9EIQ5_CUCME
MDPSCGSSAIFYSFDQDFFNIFVFFLTEVDESVGKKKSKARDNDDSLRYLVLMAGLFALMMFDNPNSMRPFVRRGIVYTHQIIESLNWVSNANGSLRIENANWFMWSVLGDPLLKLIVVDWFKVDKSFDGITLHPQNLVRV